MIYLSSGLANNRSKHFCGDAEHRCKVVQIAEVVTRGRTATPRRRACCCLYSWGGSVWGVQLNPEPPHTRLCMWMEQENFASPAPFCRWQTDSRQTESQQTDSQQWGLASASLILKQEYVQYSCGADLGSVYTFLPPFRMLQAVGLGCGLPVV